MNATLRNGLVALAVFALEACAARPHARWAPIFLARPSIAARAFDEGVASFDRGEFARALASFDTALRTEPHPVVMFNLARVHDAMGHDAAAARAYVSFLASAVGEDPALVATARDALWRLRPRIAWLRLRAPEGALVGDQVVAASDGEQLVPIDPGFRIVHLGERNVIAVRARSGDVFVLDGAQSDGTMVVGTGDFDPTLSAPHATTTAQRQP